MTKSVDLRSRSHYSITREKFDLAFRSSALARPPKYFSHHILGDAQHLGVIMCSKMVFYSLYHWSNRLRDFLEQLESF